MLCTPQCVPLAGEPQEFGKLRSGGCPARGLVRENSVSNLAFELVFLFWSSMLTRTYPIRSPAPRASNPHPVQLRYRLAAEESQDIGVRFSSGWGVPNQTPRRTENCFINESPQHEQPLAYNLPDILRFVCSPRR
jgi:hypothetical protein